MTQTEEVQNLQAEVPEGARWIHTPPYGSGWIFLDEVAASDLSVVNAAKVSFANRVSEMDGPSIGILKWLMKNQHTSPFEHGMFRFVVKAPIFVTREWMRHRTWSYNEFSTRYSSVSPDMGFYYPATPEHMRSQVGKPGRYTFEPLERVKAAACFTLMKRVYEEAYNAYLQMTGEDIGLAKEVARNVLPLATYSTFVATVDPLNLMRFLSLRNHSTALREIRDYAVVLEEIFSEHMPITHEAFIENRRFGREDLS